MAKIYNIIKSLDKEKATFFMKRFLDDPFQLFRGTPKMIHALLVIIKKTSQTIKFTMNHTINEHEDKDDRCYFKPTYAIPLLDIMCIIQNGNIDSELHKKHGP